MSTQITQYFDLEEELKQDKPKPQAFFCALKFSEYQTVKDRLMPYVDGDWIISKEISSHSHKETQGEHMHFYAEMTDKNYGLFAINTFKKYYKLNGRAVDGKARQYGKVVEIRDRLTMIAYILKDGNYETNMTSDQLAEALEISYKKEEKNPKKKQVSFLSAVLEECRKEKIPPNFDSITVKRVFRIYMKCARNVVKQLDEFIIKRHIMGIMNAIAPVAIEELYWDKIFSQEFSF